VRVLLDGLFGFSDVEEAKRLLLRKCRTYEKDRKQNLEAAVQNAARLFSSKTTVLTHCHSHTVEAILVANRKKIDRVYSTETRPLFQGRITAANLAKAGIETVQIVDGAALSMLDECDVFITGADAVLANGNVVNKIGTHMISQAAKTQNVPHYVATSRFAFDPLTFFGWPEPIEERNSREVWPQKPSRVKVRNPAFDVTPAELVSGILSERGLLSPTLFAETMIKEMDLVGHKKEFLQWMSELDKAKKKK
jgi:ribose 1,5-bisphosphate isomerase